MTLDPPPLSRLQLVPVVDRRVLYPAFAIGLASHVAVLENLHLTTRQEAYSRLSNFSIKILPSVITGCSEGKVRADVGYHKVPVIPGRAAALPVADGA